MECRLLLNLEVVGSGRHSSLESFHPVSDVLNTGEEDSQGLSCPETDHVEVAGHNAGWFHTRLSHECLEEVWRGTVTSGELERYPRVSQLSLNRTSG